MSFEEYDDAFVWRCDGGCGLTAEFPPRNFYACKDEIKARGWRITRDGVDGAWSHMCARCVKKEAAGAVVNILGRPIKRRPG